jgi:hypothetical protein
MGGPKYQEEILKLNSIGLTQWLDRSKCLNKKIAMEIFDTGKRVSKEEDEAV